MIDSTLAFIQEHHQWAGVLAFLIAFAESLIIIGFFVPGWVMLVAVGGLIGTQTVLFWPVFIGAYLGAVFGEGLGFSLGFAHSERIRQSRWMLHHQNSVLRAENLFLRYGALSLIVGRFIGPVRAVLPFVAGFLNFSRSRYWLINVITAAFWALFYLLPGMAVGVATQFTATELWPLIVHVAGVLLMAYLAWHTRSHRSWRWVFFTVAMLTFAALLVAPWSSTAVHWLRDLVSLLLPR